MQTFIESNEIKPNEKSEISGTLEARKRELEKIIEYRTKGSKLRATCRWYNEGKKYEILPKPGKTIFQAKRHHPAKSRR